MTGCVYQWLSSSNPFHGRHPDLDIRDSAALYTGLLAALPPARLRAVLAERAGPPALQARLRATTDSPAPGALPAAPAGSAKASSIDGAASSAAQPDAKLGATEARAPNSAHVTSDERALGAPGGLDAGKSGQNMDLGSGLGCVLSLGHAPRELRPPPAAPAADDVGALLAACMADPDPNPRPATSAEGPDAGASGRGDTADSPAPIAAPHDASGELVLRRYLAHVAALDAPEVTMWLQLALRTNASAGCPGDVPSNSGSGSGLRSRFAEGGGSGDGGRQAAGTAGALYGVEVTFASHAALLRSTRAGGGAAEMPATPHAEALPAGRSGGAAAPLEGLGLQPGGPGRPEVGGADGSRSYSNPKPTEHFRAHGAWARIGSVSMPCLLVDGAGASPPSLRQPKQNPLSHPRFGKRLEALKSLEHNVSFATR